MSRPGSRRSARETRRRGQSLLEFALVLPVFMVLVMAIFQLGAWAYDTQALGHGVRIGAEQANSAMSPLNARFASDPRLSTVWFPKGSVTNTIFASLPAAQRTCRENANNSTSATVAGRLGWDWGCVYDPASGKEAGVAARPSDISAALYTPLLTAISETRTATAEVYLGQANSLTITACYAVLSAAGKPVCVLTVAQDSTPGGGVGPLRQVGGLPAAATTAAPSFLIVSISAAAVRLGGGPVITLSQSTMVVLNRFVPPCNAPTNASDVKPGSCGAIF
jgi:Flp pilus assembly protein TadG